MKFKPMIMIILILFFIVTAFFSWIEGSNLLEDPDQWKYTAVFSRMMDDGEVIGKSEISQIDFLLYAIKFHPVFPSSMAVFFFILLFVIGYPYKNKWFAWPMITVCGIVLFLSFRINPTEQGTAVFLNSVRISSFLLIIVTSFILFRDKWIIKTEAVKASE
jgi:hypothetical protein